MTTTTENNKRIAKNTLLLYFRMLLTMLVGLYTSRVVLKTLGVEDYGIYNVVGGIVAMFGILNNSMTGATVRFLTTAIGKGKKHHISEVFSTCIVIHAIISFIVLLLTETIGLWFLYNKMNIPVERLEAAEWVFHCSIVSLIVMIMNVPYNAIIVAHERMGAFAFISVIEVLLKLCVACSLLFIGRDKLILYAILMCLAQLLVRILYGAYCKKSFMEIHLKPKWDKNLFHEISAFAGWNLLGQSAFIASTQGINILLNIFFGPVVNAARGISVQVQNMVNQFAISFQTALNPQIVKNFAQGNLEYMYKLIYYGSRFTCYLLLIIVLPILLYTKPLLDLWLENVPDNTVAFVRLMLIITMIDAVSNPLVNAISATGKIRKYQSIVGGLLLMILPVSYIALKLGIPSWGVYVVHLCICLLSFVSRFYFTEKLIGLSFSRYSSQVLLCILKVTALSVALALFIDFIVPVNELIILIPCLLTALAVIFVIYICGITHNERKLIKGRIKNLIYKK